MSTPHIQANSGDFADTVLMPGDPLRAKYIADHYLSEVHQVNSVRNMLAFTGEYKGRPVSVMGSGMGIPSISIYARELYREFGVKQIIRLGSCGAIQPQVKLWDLVIAMGASTDSAINRQRFGGLDFAPLASYVLLRGAADTAQAMGIDHHIGNIFSTDLFYQGDTDALTLLRHYGILATEMEAAGLYTVAAECNAGALAINTVSDHLLSGEALTAEERQRGFDRMITLALRMLDNLQLLCR